MAAEQEMSSEALECAQVKLTCWNADVYEPSDVRGCCAVLRLAMRACQPPACSSAAPSRQWECLLP
jgi:hypothetical protein